MRRRQFLSTSLAAAAAAITTDVSAQSRSHAAREFYQLRRYSLQAGPQTKLAESYFGDALIPALTRMGMGPVGAFQLDIGPQTPTYYVLIPSRSIEALAELELRLAGDSVFLKAAEPFWSAPATAPAFLRMESSLLAAFQGWPRLTSPTEGKQQKRIFQLRTYESPSNRDHVRKVEMFHHGEIEIFKNAGFHPVFFGDTLIGPRTPNLTYMLSFSSMADLDAKWQVFGADPAWKKLSTDPRYGFEKIVSNISNLILSPLAASQI